MPPTQVLAMVYLLGGVFASEKRVADSRAPVDEGEAIDSRAVLQELKNLLEDRWALTAEQRVRLCHSPCEKF